MVQAILHPQNVNHPPSPHQRDYSRHESQDGKQLLSDDTTPVETPPEQGASAANDELDIIQVFEGLRQGQLPSNNQMIRFLERLVHLPAVEDRRHKMSPDGRLLLDDANRLLQVLQQAIRTKNRDQLFQSFYYHVHQAQQSMDTSKMRTNVTDNASNETLRQEVKTSARAVMHIGRLFLVNKTFRNLIKELLSIAQGMFGDVAHLASEGLDKVGRAMDNKAERLLDQDNATENRNSRATSGVYDDALSGGGSSTQVIFNQEDQGRNQGHGQGSGDVAVGDFQPSQRYEGVSPREAFGSSSATQHQQTEVGPSSKTAYAAPADTGTDTQPPATSQEDVASRLQAYTQEKLPPEEVESLLVRLKATIVQVQRNPSYQEAIHTLFWFMSIWTHRLYSLKDADTGDIHDGNWEQAGREIKAILEDWAQGQSLNPIIHNVQSIVTDIKKDSRLQEKCSQMTDYVRRMLSESVYVSSDASTEDGKRLIGDMRELMRENYQVRLTNLFEATRVFLHAVEQDPVSKDINACLKKIYHDILFDSEGHAAFKPQLLNDMSLIFMPVLMEFTKSVTVPRVEYSDKNIDVAVENVVLSGAAMIPNVFEIKMENFMRFSPRESLASVNHQSMWIKLSQIQCDIHDVVFYYKRKTGFPKLSDRGVASLHITGEGITVNMRIVSNSGDQQNTFRMTQCHCNVHHLNIKVHDSRHDLLYKTIHPLLVRAIKRQIAKTIKIQLAEMVQRADKHVTALLYKAQLESGVDNAYKEQVAMPSQPQAAQPQADAAQTATNGNTTNAASSPEQPIKASRPGMFVTLVNTINRILRG